MQVLVNGETRDLAAGTTLAELLSQLELAERPLAVERNFEIVPRESRAQVVLQPGDRLELVTLVGGG